MKLTKAELRALLRKDFYSFAIRSFLELNPQTLFLPNWHLELVADRLEKCIRGEITRLIINVPPRSLKSLFASIAAPAYIHGHNPSTQIVCCSYGLELASYLALQCRTLMQGHLYQALFPTRIAPDKQAICDFATTRGGGRLSTSVGGVLTGRGADVIIIDDPLKPDEALSEAQRTAVNDWYRHTLFSRLNDKQRGVVIIIMQRLHEDDLVGHVLEGTKEPWTVLSLPAVAERDETYTFDTPSGQRTVTRKAGEALHPERENLETLQRIRQEQGEYNFGAQYQQSPAPFGGGMVKACWFQTYTPNTLPGGFELIINSWDTANKTSELADFTVCTTWGLYQKKLYLLDVYPGRLDYPALKRAVRDRNWSTGP